jgi:glycerol-3-phosphate dehydrogenase
MDRQEMLARLAGRVDPWDIVVIGGGATGVRLPSMLPRAASRCFCWSARTSAKRPRAEAPSWFMAESVSGAGNVSLVMEALKERGLLRRNAPHLVHDLAFVVP